MTVLKKLWWIKKLCRFKQEQKQKQKQKRAERFDPVQIPANKRITILKKFSAFIWRKHFNS